MNILSLFDWISCGRVALERAWIQVGKYFASEVDKYAIQVAKKNYPNTIHMGSVTSIHYKDHLLYSIDGTHNAIHDEDIDMIIWWSPCQSFSVAGNQQGFEWKSGLFYEYLRILKEVKPKYFLLENVKMKKEWQDEITKELWVEPIEINSALVSAQNRKRLYWTNIPWIQQPIDKWILLKDIFEESVDEKYDISEKHTNAMIRARSSWKLNLPSPEWKCGTLIASYYKIPQDWPYIQKETWIRKLTPIECERLQTLPDNYTEWVSNTQRYKAIGNWWTVDIIAHIFSYIK